MVDIVVFRQRLGVPDAPSVNAGLAITAHFFQTVINDDPLKWWRYLRGIDFHRPVLIRSLEKHKTLVRYESADRREMLELPPFAFFTDVGVSPFHTGTSWPTWLYKQFNVVRDTPALVSTASSISFDHADRVSRVGGGAQYIISRADWPKLLRVGDIQRAK